MARLCLFILVAFSLSLPVRSAEFFGPISVTHQPMVNGETSHGYREYRFLVENSSQKDTHQVGLVFPDRSYAGGDSISRISRTVALAPGARSTVSIWQPPLMQAGNSQLRVIVNGEPLGVMSIPVANHMSRHGSGGLMPGTVLVSRSVNFDELAKALRGHGRTPNSASMAVGRPDAGWARGVVPAAWSPDHSAHGSHWLELEFSPPIAADRLRVHETMGPIHSGMIFLTGASGSNLAPVSISGVPGPTSPGTPREFHFPLTPEPVQKVRLDFGSTYGGIISIDAVELVGPTNSAWAAMARASSEFSGHGSHGYDANNFLRSEVAVNEWSDTWLSFSPFDGIAISARDWQTMPPAIQTALMRYTECGGVLILLGTGTVPEPWQSAPREAIDGGQFVSPGFGKCLVFRSERLPEDGAGASARVRESLAGAALPWQNLMNEGSANNAFPVVGSVKIPVRGIVVIMLAFVVVIGPVNIIYLTRKNRRIWLLWTIPAISLVTTLAVFAYSILREGFTSDVRVEGLTFLDQANHRATTLGMAAYYCPLTPGGGLNLSSDTEATPLVGHDFRRRSGSSREVDWTRGQHLERGWVTARVPAHFQIRKSETKRERIQLDGSSVMNGLGAPIKELWLADHSGRLVRASKVAPGDKVKLESTGDAIGGATLKELAQRLAYRQLDDFDLASAPQYLRPGTYLALLEGNPFLETGLSANSGRVNSGALVYGVLESSSRP